LRLHGGDHARRWVRSHLSSTNLNRIQQRELRAYGSAGSYLARGTDVLAQAIFAGFATRRAGRGVGLRVRTTLGHVAHRLRRSIGPVGAGRAYQDYYTQFAAALRGGAAFPVPATEAVRTLRSSTRRAPAPSRTAWSTFPPVSMRFSAAGVSRPVKNRTRIVQNRTMPPVDVSLAPRITSSVSSDLRV